MRKGPADAPPWVTFTARSTRLAARTIARPLDAELAHARPQRVRVDAQQLRRAERALDSAERRRTAQLDLGAHREIEDCTFATPGGSLPWQGVVHATAQRGWRRGKRRRTVLGASNGAASVRVCRAPWRSRAACRRRGSRHARSPRQSRARFRATVAAQELDVVLRGGERNSRQPQTGALGELHRELRNVLSRSRSGASELETR